MYGRTTIEETPAIDDFILEVPKERHIVKVVFGYSYGYIVEICKKPSYFIPLQSEKFQEKGSNT